MKTENFVNSHTINNKKINSIRCYTKIKPNIPKDIGEMNILNESKLGTQYVQNVS
jgi:hypothetical protein